MKPYLLRMIYPAVTETLFMLTPSQTSVNVDIYCLNHFKTEFLPFNGELIVSKSETLEFLLDFNDCQLRTRSH